MSDYDYTRLPDGSRKLPSNGYPVEVFEGPRAARPARRVRIVRETREGQAGRRILHSEDGETFTPRLGALGVVPLDA